MPYAYPSKKFPAVKKIILGEKVKHIHADAFGEISAKTLKINAGLEELDDLGGLDKYDLTNITVDKKNPQFISDKIALYHKDASGMLSLLLCFTKKIDEYAVMDGVTHFDSEAFRGCGKLHTLKLPESVTYVNLNNLPENVENLNVPAGVTELYVGRWKKGFSVDTGNSGYFVENHVLYRKEEDGYTAIGFDGDDQTVSIIEGTVTVDECAFSGKVFKSLTLPKSLRTIRNNAFSSCRIAELMLNEGLERIGCSAFDYCALKQVVIPASVKYIGTDAFSIPELTEYKVAEGSAFFMSKDMALYSKDGKLLISVPANLKAKEFFVQEGTSEIANAFSGCKNIKAVHLPESVQALWSHAFYECDKLEDIYFAGSPEYIAGGAIYYYMNVKLHTVYPSTVCDYYVNLRASEASSVELTLITDVMDDGIDDFEYLPDGNGMCVLAYTGDEQDITIPDKICGKPVVSIGPAAFCHVYIESLSIPDTVTKLGESAFKNFEVQEMTLPPHLTEIPKSGFADYCGEELVVPEGVKKIGRSAFAHCDSLTYLYIPASVEYIDEYVFCDNTGLDRNTALGSRNDSWIEDTLVFCVVQGSYADEFLKAYRTADGRSLNITYSAGTPDEKTAGTPDEKTAGTPDEKNIKPQSETELPQYLEKEILDDNTISLTFTNSKCQDTELIIPDCVDSMPVTELTALCYIPQTIESITIPASISSLCPDSESLCWNWVIGQLNSVSIAEDNPYFSTDGQGIYTKDYSSLVMMLTRGIECYTIHDGTVTIKNRAFRDMTNLKKVVIPDSVTTIECFAFSNCTSLREIVGGNEVCCVESNAFNNTPILLNREKSPYEITGRGSIGFVAPYVFNKTPMLSDREAFIMGKVLIKYYGTKQKKYEIPDTVSVIAEDAFSRDSYSGDENDNLEEIVIPDSVTEIGVGAFKACEKLKFVNIPGGIRELKDYVFVDCFALKSISIPSSVTEIAVSAFPTCDYDKTVAPALEEILVDDGNPAYASLDGVLYSKDMTKLICFPASHPSGKFKVPDSVTTICSSSFLRNDSLKEITLSENCERIESWAFRESSLKRINLRSVKYIEFDAFYNCEQLSSVLMPNAVTIGHGAFSCCEKLSSIDFPETLERIEKFAFGSTNITNVVIPKNVKTVGPDNFKNAESITVYDSIDDAADAQRKDYMEAPNSMYMCQSVDDWSDSLRLNENAANYVVRSAETGEIKYEVWIGAESRDFTYFN